MSYQYKQVPKGLKVVWLKLIKPYMGAWKKEFPTDLEVGDITWITNSNYESAIKGISTYHIEQNRYHGNFGIQYFEVISKDEIRNEPQYEIY